jgi:hypothetical protein
LDNSIISEWAKFNPASCPLKKEAMFKKQNIRKNEGMVLILNQFPAEKDDLHQKIY